MRILQSSQIKEKFSKSFILYQKNAFKNSFSFSTETSENFIVPQPFIDSKILEEPLNFMGKLNHARDILMKHPTFSDEDALNWSRKWSSYSTFNPYILPFPLRMGFRRKFCVKPDKFGNLELLKVQNFLHLTPPAIKEQCASLKKFCTKFPEELKSDEDCERHFPVEVHTVDYIASSKSPRDERARTVERKIRLVHLALDSHARIKLKHLVGNKRYNSKTDILTIQSNRCPLRQQNSDYTNYLLTVLYFESWKYEKWEDRSYMNDDGSDGYYWWTDTSSYRNVKDVVDARNEISNKIVIESDGPEISEYSKAVKAIKLETKPLESGKYSAKRAELIQSYRKSVINLFGLDHNLEESHDEHLLD